MIDARDFTKREIKVNDRVVYPVRQGSRMWLKELVVRQVSAGPNGQPQISGTNGKGRTVSIKNLDNVVIVPQVEDPFTDARATTEV